MEPPGQEERGTKALRREHGRGAPGERRQAWLAQGEGRGGQRERAGASQGGGKEP